jgi:UDP-N-acetylmuramate dehydrogenase
MPSGDPPISPREGVRLHQLSTLGVGGPARWFIEARSVADVGLAHRWCTERGLELFVLGGGSNVVIADEGFDGLVLSMGIRGVRVTEDSGGTTVSAGAGESWDALVSSLVERGLSGVECLSGIPGTVGGTPIQNVGAYGQEVAGSIVDVAVFDRAHAAFVDLTAGDCGFSYRMSRFKGRDAGRFIVCGVTFRLRRGAPTTAYPDVAAEIEQRRIVTPGVRDVRQAVLAIRRRKGMVLDERDPDTRSVGSFFMNPVVPLAVRDQIAIVSGESPPAFAVDRDRVKIPAAWLIERSGFRNGRDEGAVGLSTKHPLAIVNRGGATTRDVLRFAARVKRAVIDWCGVWLLPEPVFVGLDGDADADFLGKAHG